MQFVKRPIRALALAAIAAAALQSSSLASIVHEWKLDEASGTTAHDAIANTNASLGGAFSWTSAKINDGFKTSNNTLGYVNAGNVSVTGSFSLSYWVNPADVTLDWRNMISKHDGATGTKSFWIGQSDINGSLTFDMYFDGTTDTYIQTPASTISSNAWSFVTASWNEQTKTQSIYVNGVLAATAVQAGKSFNTSRSSNLLFATNSTSTVNGAGTGSWARFSGTLDDVAFWNHTMSTGEAKALYTMNGTSGLSSYDAQSFDQLRTAYVNNGTTQIGTVRWSRANGLTAGEGVTQHLANGYTMQLDSSGGGVTALSTINVSYDPVHTNFAVGDGIEPAVHIDGAVDDLTADTSLGSADIRPTSARSSAVVIMLWLKDTQGADDRAVLRAELSGAAGTTYSVLDSTSPEWTRLAGIHSGFDTLIEFNSASLAGAFNWDFATHSDIVVDKLAVASVPEPSSLIVLAPALTMMMRRRR